MAVAHFIYRNEHQPESLAEIKVDERGVVNRDNRSGRVSREQFGAEGGDHGELGLDSVIADGFPSQ
jgi:hypothetical protein